MDKMSELKLSSLLNDKGMLEPKIALGMIVKNEEKVIIKTLQTAIDAVDCVYIYDTGSTDKTVQLINEFSEQYPSKQFYMKFGQFVNFEKTRNELLEWIDNHPDSLDVDFILLLDANDEFHGCQELRNFAKEHLIDTTKDEGGFYITQKWLYGEVVERYYNIFFIRPRMEWKYYGAVHEYIGPKNIKLAKTPIRCPESIYIYQNRNENCEQSFVRYHRDRTLLLEELKNKPNNPRTLFYLGQTCDCLELYNEAFYYYKLRLGITEEGLPEEIYHAKYRLGNLCIRLNKSHEEILENYLGAYEFWNRVEPLLRLCEYYLFVRKQPRIAYGYASMALFTPYPTEALLFISDTDYNYRRYNRFMVCAFEVGDFGRAYDIGRQLQDQKLAEPLDIENLNKIKEKLDELNKKN